MDNGCLVMDSGCLVVDSGCLVVDSGRSVGGPSVHPNKQYIQDTAQMKAAIKFGGGGRQI